MRQFFKLVGYGTDEASVFSVVVLCGIVPIIYKGTIYYAFTVTFMTTEREKLQMIDVLVLHFYDKLYCRSKNFIPLFHHEHLCISSKQ